MKDGTCVHTQELPRLQRLEFHPSAPRCGADYHIRPALDAPDLRVCVCGCACVCARAGVRVCLTVFVYIPLYTYKRLCVDV